MPDFTEVLGVRSSFMKRIALQQYDSEIEIHVTLARRVTYVYVIRDAALNVWTRFKAALSKGRYYNRVIRRRFDYVRKY